MPEIIAVINEIIDILAGLKAIGGDRQAELHAALEPQPAAEPVTGEENMTSPPDDRDPAPVATFTPAE
jgi:hypothetical protein